MPSLRLYEIIWVNILLKHSSEGSLNQHTKLKHPELFKGLEGFYDQNYVVKEDYNEE